MESKSKKSNTKKRKLLEEMKDIHEGVEKIVKNVQWEPVGEKLTPRQLKFCEYYTMADKNFFGNGVECYLEIYNINQSKPNWYKTACAAASRLLSNVKVCEHISSLLETGGFNDQNVEKQHLFLINQFSDLKTKKASLDSYYKLKGKFIEKIEHSGEIKTTIPYDRAKILITGRNRSD